MSNITDLEKIEAELDKMTEGEINRLLVKIPEINQAVGKLQGTQEKITIILDFCSRKPEMAEKVQKEIGVAGYFSATQLAITQLIILTLSLDIICFVWLSKLSFFLAYFFLLPCLTVVSCVILAHILSPNSLKLIERNAINFNVVLFQCLSVICYFVVVYVFCSPTKIAITIFAKHSKPITTESIKVMLDTIETIEVTKYKHKFEVEKVPDTLRFNIAVLGVDTSFIIPRNQCKDLEDIQFDLGIVAKELTTLIEDIKIIQGVDKKGNKATFGVAVLDKTCYWANGKTDSIECAGIHNNVCATIGQRITFMHLLKSRKGLICIGNACAKGGGDGFWDKLAENRATNLANCFLHNDRVEVIYKLNLGIYKGADTNYNAQRNLVLVGIFETDENVELNEALYNALLSQLLPFDIKDFENIEKDNMRFKPSKLEKYK